MRRMRLIIGTLILLTSLGIALILALNQPTKFGFYLAGLLGNKSKGYIVKRVIFREEKFRLPGYLFAPRSLGTFPGIVFCPGNLPTGKDTALYLEFCQKLAERGYVILSYDMKGYGESKRVAKFEISKDLDFVADALAALSYLSRVSIVSKEKISIIGHSSGGNIAFAAGAKDARVRDIVSLSPGDFDPLHHPLGLKRHYRNRLAKGLEYEMPMEYYDKVITPLTMMSYLPLHSPKRVLLVNAELESRHQIRFAKTLFEKISVPKEYIMIEGVEHTYGARLVDGNKILEPAKIEELVDAIDHWLKEEE